MNKIVFLDEYSIAGRDMSKVSSQGDYTAYENTRKEDVVERLKGATIAISNKVMIDGDFLTADGTTLGGDDGIAVAYGLALLDAKDIPHPRLEVVLTVSEEVGLEGATGIDLSCCKAKRLLNI